MLEIARATGEFRRFRDEMYRQRAAFFHPTTDGHSTEIIPICIGLFQVAGGDVEKTLIYGANFGRNTDTIASVAGAVAGALQGVDGMPPGLGGQGAQGSGSGTRSSWRNSLPRARCAGSITKSRRARALDEALS